MGQITERPTATQTFRERLPSPGLARYISCVWTQQVPPGSPPYPHRTTPNGSATLVWRSGTAPQLIGPQTGPTEGDLAPGTVVAGIRLRPGAVPAVFGVPAVELVDRTVRLDDVWPDARSLGEQLAEVASPRMAAALLEAALRARTRAGAPLDPIAEQTVRGLVDDRTMAVTTLAAALDISQRQLRRRCETAIGFPPKVLHRMLRFQGFLALARARHEAQANLGILAAESGFADQAHLTRECQRLAGRSPRTALREAQQHCDGNHDHAASDAAFLTRVRAVA